MVPVCPNCNKRCARITEFENGRKKITYYCSKCGWVKVVSEE